jgi:hypothetical protein
MTTQETQENQEIPEVNTQTEEQESTTLSEMAPETEKQFVSKAKAKLVKEVETKYGMKFDELIKEWEELKGTNVAKIRTEALNLSKQYELTRKELNDLKPLLKVREDELKNYQMNYPVRDLVARFNPLKPEYAEFVQQKISAKVKLSELGVPEVVDEKGQKLEQTLEELVSETVNSHSELFAGNGAIKVGHGSGLKAPSKQETLPPINGNLQNEKDMVDTIASFLRKQKTLSR